MYRFSDNLPRCQALLADRLSRIMWRCISTLALEAHFAFQSFTFQLCAILCLHKIMQLRKPPPRNTYHFMREILLVLVRLARAE